MNTQVTTKSIKPTGSITAASDTYVWDNPYGGDWGIPANWTDTATGTIAATAPTTAIAVTINGGTSGNLTVLQGTGTAAQLTAANDVLLNGAFTVAGTVTVNAAADIELDGTASLTAAALNVGTGASLQLNDASTLTVTGSATLTNDFLAAFNGSLVQLGTLAVNGANLGYTIDTGIVAVDDYSSIEIGTLGTAAPGAITIDQGAAAALAGTIESTVVVNGTLGIQANSTLTIRASNPFGAAPAISGAGTVVISENSRLAIKVADTAPIQFGAPNGTLDLSVLSCGTISGFTAGDLIELTGNGTALATSVTYNQANDTLILNKGITTVGTLALAGNYSNSLFHLKLDAHGNAGISVQTIGTAPSQPTRIWGTVGSDTLTATANYQTLTGLGGNDTLSAAGFTNIDFADTTANLNGSTIQSFGTSDVINLIDLTFGLANTTTASITSPGTLVVSNGTQSGTISIAMASNVSSGFFTATADTIAGTDVTFTQVNADAYTFGPTQGSYATAANWLDTTTGTTAALAPAFGNSVTIAGGAVYTIVTGNGVAASLATSGDVLQTGSLNIGSTLAGVSGALTQIGTLALDRGAQLILAGTASIGGLLEIGGASTLAVAQGLVLSSNQASLLAVGGASVSVASVIDAGGSISVIGVDTASSIEIGSVGGVAKGALTIDTGVSAQLAGTINGNVCVNGTLAVGGSLAIASFGTASPSVTGSGTIDINTGGTISLAGADTAAIQFAAASIPSGNPETLSLGTIIPIGTITGFATGDVITITKPVTSLTYTTGKLALLYGTTAVGTLTLAGTYTAAQFQLHLAANGQSSTITYAPTPSTVAGNTISGRSDQYLWNNSSGGVFSNAANWRDTTANATPTAAPGAGNAVTINDTTPALTPQIISGSGSAATLTVTGAANTVFTGTIAVAGLLSVTNYGAGSTGVSLAKASLTAGSLNLTSGLQLSGGSALSVLGSSTGTFISGSLATLGGSIVKIVAGTSTITGLVSVDSTSSVEFGAAGTAAASGSVTIDSGQNPTLQGNATIAAAKLVVNGNLTVDQATIGGFAGATGAISGAGTITLGALGTSGSLTLNATDSAAIAFRTYTANIGQYATESLILQGALPTGTISGFIAGDSIVVDRTVTGVSFAQTTSTLATVTLLNGATAVGKLSFSGNYATGLFQVDVAPATGFATLSLQVAPATANTASASTGKDPYTWIGNSGASWATAGAWKDTTLNAAATTMPGTSDPVTIAGSTTAGQYTTIGGNGSAATLTVSGNVLLTGQVSAPALVNVGTSPGAASTLLLDSAARLATGTLQVNGRLEVEAASSATVGGNTFLNTGSLLALGGSTLQSAGLVGNGNGNVIAIDANSYVKIGTSGPTAAGALTQAGGAKTAFAGSIFGSVVLNGTWSVPGGGALWIDMAGTAESDPYQTNPTITGTGTLSISEGSTLGLGVADNVAIQFNGPNATLALAALPTAAISGFTSGDQIQVDKAVTAISYNQTNATTGTLTLLNGTATVGVLKLAGYYAPSLNAFHLDPAANGATATITLQSLLLAPTSSAPIGGTTASDFLVATANNQTITGLGRGDTISGGNFNGIDFKDLTANLNGSTILNFAKSDILDFTDMLPGSAKLTYSGGNLSVTDGTHAATLALSFATTPAIGSFHPAGDGSVGTKLTWS